MDCEKFDQVVMDALYGELDELTAAALRRHVDTCVRCSEAWNGLRSTREGASLPLEEPSDDLEARILTAALAAQRKTPWHRQILRGLAWAGSHAMRPQFAMAALFFLVIGSSLLLLRAKPGTMGTAPVSVTERGVPTPDEPDRPAAAAPAAAEVSPAPPTEADAKVQADEASRGKVAQDKLGDGDDAKTALSKARATRDQSGCSAAIPLYADVGSRFSGSSAAADATWESAQCQKTLGNNEKARELLSALKDSDGYRQRAEEALRETNATSTPQAAAAAGGGVVASRAAAAPAPAAKPSDPLADPTPAKGKATTAPGGGPTRSVPAAPKRNADVNSAYGY
jgi:Putative zinc-finger